MVNEPTAGEIIRRARRSAGKNATAEQIREETKKQAIKVIKRRGSSSGPTGTVTKEIEPTVEEPKSISDSFVKQTTQPSRTLFVNPITGKTFTTQRPGTIPTTEGSQVATPQNITSLKPQLDLGPNVQDFRLESRMALAKWWYCRSR